MPPVVAPVKKTPSVRDVMQDPEETKTITKTKTEGETENQFPTVQGGVFESQGSEETKTITKTEGETAVETKTTEERGSEATETITKTDGETEPTPADEKFVESWRAMFDLVFAKTATVYYPLKDTIPQCEGNIIVLTVKNELVKSSFEEHTRLALQYLRNNYDPKIDNIEVKVADVEEKPNFVYGTQDQMNDLYAENADLPEFLKILNLSAKDI